MLTGTAGTAKPGHSAGLMTASVACNGPRGGRVPHTASTYASEPCCNAGSLIGAVAAILAVAAVGLLIFGSRRRRQATADTAEVFHMLILILSAPIS